MRMYGQNKEASMKLQVRNSGRNTLLAVLLGFIMPGLGQIYNGELIKGASYFILIIVLFAAGVRGILWLPDSLLMYGALAVLIASTAFYIFTIVDAFNGASRADAAYLLKPYNRWYFYLAFLLLGFVIRGLWQGYIKDHYIETYRIPTESMEPAVQRGDCVLADKTAYQRMAPKKGDVVIFIDPDDRSKRFIKRIEALPGDMITKPGEVSEKVPHGYAYMLGDNRGRSLDSRQFGYIPLRDVVAKVRQVYYSSDIKGILWERIGVTIGSR
jgi:signal peptidase I